jgi:8-oxo-dGTP pyrophosphatase MutT (NUDIX family)
MSRDSRPARQVGALPIEIGKNGQVYVLLVTSRETKRWVIPKGCPSRKMSDSKAAAREARQEAGVTGKIDRKPVGYYSYRKILPEGSRVVEVAIYALWVKKEQKSWSEQKERTRIWATFSEAAKMVREPGLQRLFNALDDEIEGRLGVEVAEKLAEIAKIVRQL